MMLFAGKRRYTDTQKYNQNDASICNLLTMQKYLYIYKYVLRATAKARKAYSLMLVIFLYLSYKINSFINLEGTMHKIIHL